MRLLRMAGQANKRCFGGHEEGDSGSESDSQSETYGDQSNPEEVDNDMLMEAG
jgi:hypothetical protein